MEINSELKQSIIRWFDNDNVIRQTRETVKQLKNENKKLEEYIIKELHRLDINRFKTDLGKLELKTKKTKETISGKSLNKYLSKIIGSESKAEEITSSIVDSLQVKEKEVLIRK